jgi:hypothetical protein
VNAWFPRLRADGVIASGNNGIWLTQLNNAQIEKSPVGAGPIWAAQRSVYNRNNGTTQVGAEVVPYAYNDYVGSDHGEWAGFAAVGLGVVDRYNGHIKTDAISGICAPRFCGASFGYLEPFQTGPTNVRTLWLSGATRAAGVIIDWVADRGGNHFLYTVGVGTYGKRIMTHKGEDVTIRSQQDEQPLVTFVGPDDLPWIVSGTTNSGTFVRMVYSAFGYRIPGDLFYPDARMIGDRLRVVGSFNNGAPNFDNWVDFDPAKRIDLRTV